MQTLDDILNAIKKRTIYSVYLNAVGMRNVYSDLGGDMLTYPYYDEPYQIRAINIKDPQEDLIKKIEKLLFPNALVCQKDYSSERVIYGPLTEKVYSERVVSKKKKGIMGWFGLKEKVHEIVEEEKHIKLSDIGFKENDKAYLIMLTMHGLYSDINQRDVLLASVNIIGDRETTERIVLYLQRNPQDYYKLIESMFPEKDYPKVSKNVIGKRSERACIVFTDPKNKRVSAQIKIKI